MGSSSWTLTLSTLLASVCGVALVAVIVALFVLRSPLARIHSAAQTKARFKLADDKKNNPTSATSRSQSKDTHGEVKTRPSRPSSLPCLPEEKLYYPSASDPPHRGTLPICRPSALFRPSSPTQLHHVPDLSPSSQQPSSRIHQKLSLALHSDGSEASNSSSSASAATELDERQRLTSASSASEGVVVRRQRREYPPPVGQQHPHHQQQQQHQQSRLPLRRSFAHDDDIDELADEWSPRPHHSQSQDESVLDGMSNIFEDSETSLTAGTDVEVTSSSRSTLIDLSLAYSPNASKLAVRISELRRLAACGSNLQLRLLLLPDRKQRHRSKIRTCAPDNTLQILETFIFTKVDPDELCVMGLRFRLYCCEKLRRERLMAETFFSLAKLDFDVQREQQLVLRLEPRSSTRRTLGSLGRSTSSSGCSSKGENSPTALGLAALEQFLVAPRGDRPELLLGLAYNGTTGRLTTEIMKASNLRSMMSSRTPDVCIKVILLSCTGQEIGRAKTTVRRNQTSPTFLESFMFQVTLFQIAEVTLLLTAINKRSLKRRELLGWMSLGFDNCSEDAAHHWQEMRESNGEQVCRWHTFLNP